MYVYVVTCAIEKKNDWVFIFQHLRRKKGGPCDDGYVYVVTFAPFGRGPCDDDDGCAIEKKKKKIDWFIIYIPMVDFLRKFGKR